MFTVGILLKIVQKVITQKSTFYFVSDVAVKAAAMNLIYLKNRKENYTRLIFFLSRYITVEKS